MITIRKGESIARILEKGAYLSELRISGSEILHRTQDGEPTHGGSAVLIPYAGRVKNAEYSYGGRKYSLPRNNGNNSIHGLLKDMDFKVEYSSGSSVSMESLLKSSSYPSSLKTSIAYSIWERGLTVEVSASNVGETDAPFVAGFHPYFLADEGWTLEHSEKLRMLNFADEYFPDGTFSDADYNNDSNISKREFDSAFVGGGELRLMGKTHKLTMKRTNMEYLVIYNGKYAAGKSVAIEPMTGAPDAFNNGMGLISIPPGGSFECGFSLEVQ